MAKRKSAPSNVRVTPEGYGLLADIARTERRSIQQSITVLCEFWMKYHCPECGYETAERKTCGCEAAARQ